MRKIYEVPTLQSEITCKTWYVYDLCKSSVIKYAEEFWNRHGQSRITYLWLYAFLEMYNYCKEGSWRFDGISGCTYFSLCNIKTSPTWNLFRPWKFNWLPMGLFTCVCPTSITYIWMANNIFLTLWSTPQKRWVTSPLYNKTCCV